MKGKGHRDCTTMALDLLEELDGHQVSFAEHRKKIIAHAIAVDTQHDVEMVRVKGIGPLGRDNPHQKEWYVPEHYHDRAGYTIDKKEKYPFLYWTTLNHYIDLRKGPGEFDDYDGYSYYRGSGQDDQHQTLIGKSETWGVDHVTAVYLNDRYIHAPHHPHYQDCSPALERYSFPEDKGNYATALDEIKDRFPLAKAYPAPDTGFPFSVFFPIDNIVRYWYGQYIETRDPETVGWLVHPMQDCTIPHHAVATIGNWHSRYEKDLNANLDEWVPDDTFREQAAAHFKAWSGHDDDPPESISMGDVDATPCMNWRVDMLGTWLAFNAFREYEDTYDYFREGYELDKDSQRKLTEMAVGMSMLVMVKADTDQG